MLLIKREEIEKLIDMSEVIEAVEKAFLDFSMGKTICPKRLYMNVKEDGFIFIMPAYIATLEALGLKVVTQYLQNLKKGLPTVLASILLNDSETGKPIALMEGTYITALRTGAFSGVATKYLARKDSEIVCIIGAGAQAETQLWAMLTILKNIKEVKVYDVISERAEKFADKMSRKWGIDIKIMKNCEECIKGSDVIITATTSKNPVLDGDWIKEGTHINSIGWMGPEGRELDDKTIKKAKIIVDSREGVFSESGDIIIPLKSGIISEKDVYAELGEIVSGIKKGRINEKEITCFKTVGLAIGDIATAKLVYEKALKEGVGIQLEL